MDLVHGSPLAADRHDLLTMSETNDPLNDWAEKALSHRFKNPTLLREALTHASYGGRDYERLEFLGDRVLGCVIADWLYTEFAEVEGKLARRFASLVDRETCAEVARRLGVPKQLFMDKAARASRVHESDNVLGDMCEALIGALYVDGGMDAARRFIRRAWEPFIDTATKAPKDPKSRLQEWAQGQGLPLPHYEIVRREGPDHAPIFRVRVTVRGREAVEAEGASKQEAEKHAAQALLEIVAG